MSNTARSELRRAVPWMTTLMVALSSPSIAHLAQVFAHAKIKEAVGRNAPIPLYARWLVIVTQAWFVFFLLALLVAFVLAVIWLIGVARRERPRGQVDSRAG